MKVGWGEICRFKELSREGRARASKHNDLGSLHRAKLTFTLFRVCMQVHMSKYNIEILKIHLFKVCK